jgi:hypothetical protein
VPGRQPGRLALNIGDLHRARAAQAAPPANEVDTGLLEPADLPVVLPSGREAVASPEDRVHVERGGDRLPGARQLLGGMQCGGAAQQRLGRHAGPVGALAADEFVFDDGDAEAALYGPVGDVLAGGSRADHDHVISQVDV